MRRPRKLCVWIALAGASWTCGLAAQKAPPPRPGQELLRFGKEGIGPSQMKRAEEIAVDSEGFIYTADWSWGAFSGSAPTASSTPWST